MLIDHTRRIAEVPASGQNFYAPVCYIAAGNSLLLTGHCLSGELNRGRKSSWIRNRQACQDWRHPRFDSHNCGTKGPSYARDKTFPRDDCAAASCGNSPTTRDRSCAFFVLRLTFGGFKAK